MDRDDVAPLSLVEVVSLATVFFQIVLSIASNSAFGRGVGDVSCKYTQRFAPSNEAFGIWLPIYLLAFLMLFEQAVLTQRVHLVSNTLYGLAWLFASFWTPTFTTNTPIAMTLAALFLALTSFFSLAAVLSSRLWLVSTSLLTACAYSLLAGWTLVAASLNVAIAYAANDNNPDPECPNTSSESYNLFGDRNSMFVTVVPLLLTILVTPISISLNDPVLTIPIWWALFWGHASFYNYVAFAVASISIIVATTRFAYGL